MQKNLNLTSGCNGIPGTRGNGLRVDHYGLIEGDSKKRRSNIGI